MTKKVEGFLTSSGAFYRTETEANYHEARENLANTLDEQGYSPDVLTLLDKFSKSIAEYLCHKIELDQQREAEKINAGISRISNTEGQEASADQDTFYIDSGGNVSDVGSGEIRSKKGIQDDSAVNGS